MRENEGLDKIKCLVFDSYLCSDYGIHTLKTDYSFSNDSFHY